jgi:hypothetical protein
VQLPCDGGGEPLYPTLPPEVVPVKEKLACPPPVDEAEALDEADTDAEELVPLAVAKPPT